MFLCDILIDGDVCNNQSMAVYVTYDDPPTRPSAFYPLHTHSGLLVRRVTQIILVFQVRMYQTFLKSLVMSSPPTKRAIAPFD